MPALPQPFLSRPFFSIPAAATNRIFLARALKRAFAGAEVLVAEHGQEALDIVTGRMRTGQRLPDLITMDGRMPVMAGGEAVSRLRQIRYRGLIVGVTGSALLEERNEFIGNGAVRCLPRRACMLASCDSRNMHANALLCGSSANARCICEGLPHYLSSPLPSLLLAHPHAAGLLPLQANFRRRVGGLGPLPPIQGRQHC